MVTSADLRAAAERSYLREAEAYGAGAAAHVEQRRVARGLDEVDCRFVQHFRPQRVHLEECLGRDSEFHPEQRLLDVLRAAHVVQPVAAVPACAPAICPGMRTRSSTGSSLALIHSLLVHGLEVQRSDARFLALPRLEERP